MLYPAPLRDVLLEVGIQGIFRPRWTDKIHDEWIRNLLLNRPDLRAEQLERTRNLMNQAIPDCLVIGYERIVDTLQLPDKDDRHVLAAAIMCRAGATVTFNLADFPEEALEPHGIEAQHPDEFLVYQFDLAPDAVCEAIKRLRGRLRHPPMDVETYLHSLTCQKLSRFVERLGRFRESL